LSKKQLKPVETGRVLSLDAGQRQNVRLSVLTQ